MDFKKTHGSVLVIGNYPDKVLDELNKNASINDLIILSNIELNSKKRNIFNFKKKIYIKELRKKFKKKSFDFIIVDYKSVKNEISSFVRSSLYLCKNKLVFTGQTDEELKKYHRYNLNIISKKDSVSIVIGDTKPGFFRGKIFATKDLLTKISDYISNILSA